MYSDHFGFAELPFGLTPDTSYLFSSAQSRAALNTLLVAVKSGEGFIKVTGEIGTGKTLLCRKFMSMMGDDFVTVYIPNPYMEPRTLLLTLADELGVAPTQGQNNEMDQQHHLLTAIARHLILMARLGKRVLLCLDEAQAMPLESLEALRLLTNLETEKRKWLQVVMFGQPEFNRTLALDSVQQLTQRITFDFHLRPLSRDDIEYYVAHRLRIAGFTGARLFSPSAISRLYATSGGIPRLINIIAHKALMLTYGEGKQEVSWRHVQMAAKDTLASKQLGAQLSKEISKRLTLTPLNVLVMVCATAGVAWISTK